MTQPEETTAALIARLHEELTESNRERDDWHAAHDRIRNDRNEQRARAEKAEADRDKARLGLSDIANQWQAEKSRADGLAVALQVSDRDRMQIGSDLRQRAEKAEAELAQERLKSQTLLKCKNIWLDRCTKARKECDEFNVSHAALDRLLAERTRERDEAIQRRREVCERFDITVESLKAVTKQRDEAREQLAKLEWPIMFGWGHEDACALCKGCKPTDRPKYTADNYGHRPTCWFAKKEAGANKIRNHRQGCPARTADDVAWVDSQWQVNGCRTAPIEGPRPRPIGCEGCKCAEPGEREEFTYGTLHHPRLGWVKMQHIGRVNDLLKSARLFIGCDFGMKEVAAFNVYRYACGADVGKKDATKSEPVRQEAKAPALPGPKFAIGQAVRDEYRSRSGVITGFWRVDIYKPWQYEFGVGHVAFEGELTEDRPAAKEPARSGLPVAKTFTEQRDEFIANHARPEPRFKVGEKVHSSAFGTLGEVINRQFVPNLGWRYGVTGNLSASELDLKPAPKFAVGEWVEWMSAPVSEGGRICSGPVLRRWFADLTNDGWWYEVPWRIRESDLTAQTPQHKHDCKGSIFLGRHEGFDLWWRPTMREVVAVEPAVAHCYAVDGDLYNLAAVEAWRRAVARGLVKP